MPPKKINKVANTDGSKIINFYEHLPAHLLRKPENPNFALHHLEIPLRMCIVAPSSSGKTNFLLNIITLFSKGNKGTFSDITILTANKDEPLYNHLETLSDQIVIKEGLNNIPQLDKYDKLENHLLVFDDLVLSKDLSVVEKYYIRARKMNVSVIFISQSYFKIPKIIRNNCSYMVLLKLSGQREVNVILSEFSLGVSKDQLLNMYKFATNLKFSPLVIDLSASPEERFRKGFLEILNPDNYN